MTEACWIWSIDIYRHLHKYIPVYSRQVTFKGNFASVMQTVNNFQPNSHWVDICRPLKKKKPRHAFAPMCEGYNYNRYTHSFFHFLSIDLACRPSATFNTSSHFTAFCIHRRGLPHLCCFLNYNILQVCCHASSCNYWHIIMLQFE